MMRRKRVVNPFIALLVDIPLGAKGKTICLLFGSLINDGANLARYWEAICFSFDKVLLNFWANHFKKIAKVSQDREVSEDRFLGLDGLINSERKNRQGENQSPQDARGVKANERSECKDKK